MHTADELTLTFAQIEAILGASLPRLALRPTFWTSGKSGANSSQGRSWIDAGFRTKWVRPAGSGVCVTFERVEKRADAPSTSA